MTTKSKVPQIRFKGFDEEWDNKELTNYSSKIGDGLHGTPKYVSNTGIYFINGNNLESGSIHITDDTKEVSKEDSLKNDKQLNSNTILMSINGTIGNLAWYQNETIMLGKSVAYITLKNCDKSYMYCYLQSKKISKYFSNNLTGSTIKNLGLKTIRETEISIPTEITEQTKIGNYFQQLDKLIEEKEKKYQKLKQFKKAMLEKMFPKNGADTPEIRFKGFSGKWEEKKLKEVSTFYNGRAYKQEELLKNGKYRVLRVGNFFTNDSWYSSNLELEENKYCDNGDLLYAWSASFGPRIWFGEKVIYHYHIWKVENHSQIVKQFLFIVLDNETVKMKTKNANGFALLHITKETIENWKIKLPLNLEEQTKIGNYFQKLDKQIDLQQKELEKLKNIKKASLDKMFV